MKLSYNELVTAAENVKASYSVTDEETRNLEEGTRLQTRCKLWEVHRAGRVTASNLRAFAHTDAIKVIDKKSMLSRDLQVCKYCNNMGLPA